MGRKRKEEEDEASGEAWGGLSHFALNISILFDRLIQGKNYFGEKGGKEKDTEGGKKCFQLLDLILLS